MNKMRRLLAIVAILVVTLSAVPLAAQDRQPTDEERRKADELRDYIKANYTKYEYLAPMRDGVRGWRIHAAAWHVCDLRAPSRSRAQ
jgi:hypothetical protein